MTFGVSESVKKTVIEEMRAKGLESVTKYGFTFSTEKQDCAIPTGEYTKDGKMIYILPW